MTSSYNIDTIYPLSKVPPAPLKIAVIYYREPFVDNEVGREEYQQAQSSNRRAQVGANRKIPKPHGQVGCLGKGGYTLHSELGWDKAEYKAVQKFVQDCLRDYIRRAHLRAGYPISAQPKDILRQVQEEAKRAFPILSLYEDDWPSRDMISTYLSNSSSPHLRGKVEHE